MNPNPGSPRPPLSLPVERIRSKLIGILGADRWVEGRYHGVAPHSTAELRRLFQNYPGLITVVGTGSDFPSTYQPPPDTLLLFTARLRETFHHSLNGATLSLSAGYDIPFLTSTL
ncbi:MAG: hypothetical protein FJY67_10930, partial [Calditrichaeota bacterium]|nr:hypothetical protein [Calditrichota bacterium]